MKSRLLLKCNIQHLHVYFFLYKGEFNLPWSKNILMAAGPKKIYTTRWLLRRNQYFWRHYIKYNQIIERQNWTTSYSIQWRLNLFSLRTDNKHKIYEIWIHDKKWLNHVMVVRTRRQLSIRGSNRIQKNTTKRRISVRNMNITIHNEFQPKKYNNRLYEYT